MYLKTFGILSHRKLTGKYKLRYHKFSCLSIDIESDIYRVTATKGKVVLNRFFYNSNNQKIDIKPIFKRGEEVLVTFGYLPSNLSTEEDFMRNIDIFSSRPFGFNSEDLHNNHSTFTLYISDIKINNFNIIIELEDYMFNLKNHVVAYNTKFTLKRGRKTFIGTRRAKTGASVNMSYGVGFKKAHLADAPKTISVPVTPFISKNDNRPPFSFPLPPSYFKSLTVKEKSPIKPLIPPILASLEKEAEDVPSVKSVPSIDLIATIKKGLQAEYPELEKDQIVVFPEDLSIQVNEFKVVDVTWGQFIEKVSKDYSINFTFFGKKLFIYLPYLKAASELNSNSSKEFNMFNRDDRWKHYNFDMKYEGIQFSVSGSTENNQENDFFNDNNQVSTQPTQTYNMEYHGVDELTLQVKGKNFKRNGKYEEYKYPETNSKYDITIDQVFFNLNKTDFTKGVQDEFNQNLNFGFKGNFTTWGYLPNTNQREFDHNNTGEGKDRLMVMGDRVSFLNTFVFSSETTRSDLMKDILISQEEYLVKKISYTYGDGIKQKVEIGRQIGTTKIDKYEQ